MGAMDADELKMYLQNVEEYVMDEDKIVTYKWLSKNLDIHVNTAKQLLYYFASTQKNNVNTTYLIGGVLNDETGCKILIVREEDLEVIKKQFKVITSQHVYSIQKAKVLRDLNLLYAVDSYRRTKDEGKERLGAITYSHPVLRSKEEVERLRKKSRAESANVDGKQWPSSVASTNKKQPVSSVKKEEVQTSAEISKEENNAKKDVKTGGIAAMFAAQSNKSKQHDSAEGKSKVIEKPAAKSKGNSRISMFFSRQPEKTVEKVSANDDTASNSQDKQKEKEDEGFATDENLKPQQSENKEVKVTKKSENTKKDENTVMNKVEKKNAKRTGKKQDKSKKRKLNAEKDVSSTKKRKRIVIMSDSEESSDDDIFDKDDDGDDEAPDSPPPHETAPQQPESDPEDMIPPTPEIEYKKGRKRVRKLKDKTYLDEDGYLLTKKEYVFESCTDSEGEAEKENERKKLKEIEVEETTNTNSAVKQLPAKKKTSPQKTKQASLMNFFKKNS
ncbi:DNA polymerase delta subunit 3-like isoform X2 [Periplaneta americana]|uniref:DNA polymerase delta subunit 3-like isoform X2 n=1 Tax=Periplaneta americana TaxID=6978 RepID=UPI0037E83BB1